MEAHILWGLSIPVLFFGFTGLVKCLIKKELLWSNFYLGIDIALAALANSIVNIVDESHAAEGPKPELTAAVLGNHMFYTTMYMMASIGSLLVVMTVHQKYECGEENGNQRLWRGIWLGGVSNVLGGALLAVFIYLKLRGLI